VTVGLDGVHPIGLTKPRSAPWTKVSVRKYTDWGVVLVYTDNGNQIFWYGQEVLRISTLRLPCGKTTMVCSD
jgi:hypothetical protein